MGDLKVMKKILKLSFLVMELAVVPAWSQVLPPAAGVSDRDLRVTPISPEAKPISPPVLNPSAESSPVPVQMTVLGFNFTGNDNIPTKTLESLVGDYVNRQLDLPALDAVADRVSRYYRQQGYSVARAYIPPHTSIEGVVQIAILEGKYALVNLRNTSVIDSDRLSKTIANNVCAGDTLAQCKNQVITDEPLERAVLLMRDLPGMTANVNLQAGATMGTSDLGIHAKDTAAHAVSIGFDNYGTKSTGVTRMSVNADFNNPAHNGDQLSLGITTTGTHSNSGNVSYSVPVDYSGMRVGASLARGFYRLGAGFENILSHGTSTSLNVFSSYPIIRSVNRSLYFRAVAEARAMDDNIDAGSILYSHKTASTVRIGLNGDAIDNFGGGGYNIYSINYVHGRIGISGNSVAADLAGANTQGDYSKLTYSIGRQQTIAGATTLYSALNGQFAGAKNLDGSEQIGIGGPTAVRAYAGEASGSTGAVGVIELRYTQPPTSLEYIIPNALVTYGAFVDRGWVKIYRNTWQPSQATTNTRALFGYGVSLTLQSKNFQLRGIYAVHPDSQPSQVDPSSKEQVWLQLGFNF